LLEVCSPGIERELVRDEHFQQFIGADIMVKMHRPIENIGKEFAGVLKGYEDSMVTISDHSDENEVTINKKDAVWIKLDDFN
jgi:ribosome maturation factor RimP